MHAGFGKVNMAKLAARSKKEAVYDWLLAQIVEGNFAPNSPLVIDEVARNLEVSQIPIREALQQLESEGFVTIRPYAGVTVTDLKPDMISEVFALLETVEIISGRMACVNICDDQLPQIEQLLRIMDGIVDDPNLWSEHNAQFHHLICRCSEATLVPGMLARLLLHWDRVRRQYLDDVFGQRIAKAQEDHWLMFEAIKANDPDRLETIVRDHNRSALRDYISYLRRTGHDMVQMPSAWNLDGP